jgi:hypothetical protein
METIRVNDLRVMLTGAPAVSWLAGQSYEIGIYETLDKRLSEDDGILKVNSETCLIFGKEQADGILREWDRSPPDGVTLHKLTDAQREKMMKWLGKLV